MVFSHLPEDFFSFFSIYPDVFYGSLIQIGPPNSTFLTSKDKKTWTAKDVADSVLSDKSALVKPTSNTSP